MSHLNSHSPTPLTAPKVTDTNTLGTLEQELELKVQQLADAHREMDSIRNEFQQFASSISHELGAPLRAVDGFCKLLSSHLNDQLDPKSQLCLQYIEHGTTRIRKMSRAMQHFSSVLSKASTFEQIDLNESLNLALAKLIPQVVKSNAQISSDQLPTLVADRYQMTQLFICFLENAIRFRRNETPKIHISASETPDSWRISIADNGIGILPRNHESIFKMFRVLEPKESAIGAGVGLTICRRIVARHNGRIWQESNQGIGSKFHFSIPRNLQSLESDESS